MHTHREQMVTKTREEVTSILTLAGLRPERMWELANGYWPLAPSYDDVRSPWWLAQTSIGLIRIGSRKRVVSIEWDACKVRGIVTTDDVTKRHHGPRVEHGKGRGVPATTPRDSGGRHAH